MCQSRRHKYICTRIFTEKATYYIHAETIEGGGRQPGADWAPCQILQEKVKQEGAFRYGGRVLLG